MLALQHKVRYSSKYNDASAIFHYTVKPMLLLFFGFIMLVTKCGGTQFQPKLMTRFDSTEHAIYAPIRFTKQGLTYFLKNVYNNSSYGESILPNNFGHFLQLFRHGRNKKQDHQYMISAIRLFRQKVGETDYIAATEFLKLCKQLPFLFVHHVHASGKSGGQRKMKELLCRLLENCTNKLLWEAHDAIAMWALFVQIGDELENLYQEDIIEDLDDLNDLLHMLVDRFICTIKLVGSDLPQTFYSRTQKLLQKDVSWLSIEELEEHILTKKEKLLRALMHGQFAAQAYHEFGIVA